MIRIWKPRKLKHELAGLLTLYILLSPVVAAPLYNFLLFRPDRTTYNLDTVFSQIETAFKTKKQDVWIVPPDSNKIHAWYFSLPNARRTFLISHGNAGNIAHRSILIATLLKSGGSVLIYDYEGYGSSEGKPSRPAVVEDGVAAYDYLTKVKKIAGKDIILYGESLGCGVSCQISKQRQVGAIILQSGWTSLMAAARDRLKLLWLYPKFCFSEPSLDNLAVLTQKHPPLLLIHGKKDNILPARYSEELYAKACAPKQLLLLPDAEHNDIGIVDMPQYFLGISKFLTTVPE
jgi:fermentation-respiration switch protein FrsA (DUF1100 family)